MLSSLPTWGPGHLRFRDNDPNASGTEREIIFLQAGDIFYKNMGEQCVELGIGVDMFIMSSAYVDIATVGRDILEMHTNDRYIIVHDRRRYFSLF
jgi:protein transport protein SEC24